ncbi:murein hydrolase activator EnvC family protein [Paenibacillus typhae]|uniref:Murein DD-endopeptidase MepM and murein hydrolase activator NlpD, contain LysM domain n=1 Tax=Paenibacillus typhae TaxID=1174501 RepID=A0A1G8GLG7_9BACL|nr:M23 family metallopeptidase [Paenibacillus typhae]SDH95151.1 Murein DD-endopeptidase MepM and murein hydrolase activator NlpD, contain LysM domain [Paenibacillus typhae]
MKKRFVAIHLAFWVTLVIPAGANAKTAGQIDQELNQLQQLENSTKQQQRKAEQDKSQAQHYLNKNQNYLQQVLSDINNIGTELTQISAEIEETEVSLEEITERLKLTEERIENRQGWITNRLQLTYMNGPFSYWEVLLSSSSFGNFIERVNVMQSILEQDRMLLDEQRQDQATLEQQQQQLNENYADVRALYADAEAQKKVLEQKEQEKLKLISLYNADIIESEEISEEQEAQLLEIATKKAALEKEKNKLRAAQIYSNSRPGANTVSSNGGTMAVPVAGARITSTFGSRVHPITKQVKQHNGVDMAAAEGTTIKAAEDGIVIVADWWGGYGNTVIVDHGNNMWTLYPHIRNNGIKVQKGQAVKRGQKIAEVGSTGNSTGPHLHFEIRVNGKAVNPMPYL